MVALHHDRRLGGHIGSPLQCGVVIQLGRKRGGLIRLCGPAVDFHFDVVIQVIRAVAIAVTAATAKSFVI